MVLKQNEAMPGAKVGTYTVPHSYKYTVVLILSFYKVDLYIQVHFRMTVFLNRWSQQLFIFLTIKCNDWSFHSWILMGSLIL